MTVEDLLAELALCSPGDEIVGEIIGSSEIRLTVDGEIVAEIDTRQ